MTKDTAKFVYKLRDPDLVVCSRPSTLLTYTFVICPECMVQLHEIPQSLPASQSYWSSETWTILHSFELYGMLG